MGKTKRGKGLEDHGDRPIAAEFQSQFTSRVPRRTKSPWFHATLAQLFVKPFPMRLIGDNAYKSVGLDAGPGSRWRATDRPAPQNETSRIQDGRPRNANDRDGESTDSLPGSRTFGGSSSGMTDTPIIFLRCYTSPAASFSCEGNEMGF